MRRLTQRQSRLAVIPLLASLLAALATVPVLVYHMFYRSPERMRLVPVIIWVIAAMVIGTAPGIAGALAVRLTRREQRTNAHLLIRASALSRQAIAEAHVAGVIVRLRGWLALMAGLTPALLLATRYHSNAYFTRTMKVTRFYYMLYNIPSPRWQNIQYRLHMMGWQPEFHGWAIGLWGMVLLGIVIGVGLSFRWESETLAVLGAASIAQVAALLFFAIMPVVDLEHAPLLIHLVLIGLLTFGPFAAVRSLLRVIPRWV